MKDKFIVMLAEDVLGVEAKSAIEFDDDDNAVANGKGSRKEFLRIEKAAKKAAKAKIELHEKRTAARERVAEKLGKEDFELMFPKKPKLGLSEEIIAWAKQ